MEEAVVEMERYNWGDIPKAIYRNPLTVWKITETRRQVAQHLHP